MLSTKNLIAGYVSLIIEPQIVSKLNKISGKMKIPYGIVAVDYKNNI
ncbi:MAG: hypothetical protein IJA88_04310 [Clostridia bacterium]|nr:hypothetical protein [Clostridia bacterium]